ncbi:hypothetical protein GCM10009864_75810 [Streptomyces lunalinharesii]|uniref:Secreted protein n=1 Tax=Streptomyces lunalinharesii TaxID=333384 RepID=A0ABP6FE94_9ACTN
MRVQGGREVGDGAELVLAVAVGALLDACSACRTVLEESGGQGAGEGTEYGNDRRPYGHQVWGPRGWRVGWRGRRTVRYTAADSVKP